MFSIAPIGSCRIATPLRLNRELYGYDINIDRNYGFCHSSSEAVQQLQFMLGDDDIDPSIWPLVARGKSQDSISSQTHSPSDLYVVEISSAKRLTVGETCIQINYLKNEYADFFEDSTLAREFWRLARDGSQSEIDAFLERNWSDNQDKIDDNRLLRLVRMQLVSEDDLRRDIQYIMERTPEVLFVTHVNASKPDGSHIKSRSDFIDLVTKVANGEGAKVYNPTLQMLQMGQELAIEDYSDSLAHFTPEFCYRFFSDWYNLAIEPAIDAAVVAGGSKAISSILRPNVTALLDQGRKDFLASRLDRLSSQIGLTTQLSVLQAQIDIANNASESAYKRIAKEREIDIVDPTLLSELADIAFENGDSAFTLKCLQKLRMLCEPISQSKLCSMSQILTNKGNTAEAVKFLELAIQIGPKTEDLVKAYVELVNISNPEQFMSMRASERQDLFSHLPIYDWVAIEVKLGARSAKVLPTALKQKISMLSPSAMSALLTKLDDDCTWPVLAELLGFWRESQDLPQLMDRVQRSIVEDWFQDHYCNDGSMSDRADILSLILTAHPMHREGRIEQRKIRSSLIHDARELYKERNSQGLCELEEISKTLTEQVVEVPLFRARLAFDDEDFALALTLARQVVDQDAQSAIGWLTLLRSAFAIGDLFVVDEACKAIISLEDPGSEAWVREAKLKQQRLPVLAFKAARSEPDLLKAHRLLGLALRNVELKERALVQQSRVESNIAKELRSMAKSDADVSCFIDRVTEVLKVVKTEKNVEMIVVAAGRLLVKNKDFNGALAFWDKAVTLDPANENHAFQRDRCYEKLGLASAGVGGSA